MSFFHRITNLPLNEILSQSYIFLIRFECQKRFSFFKVGKVLKEKQASSLAGFGYCDGLCDLTCACFGVEKLNVLT